MGEESYEGQMPVRVSASDVHKAVRNILKNEMNLDPSLIREEALAIAKKQVYEQVDKYLQETRYDHANLDERVRLYLQNWFKADFEKSVRNAVEQMARNRVEELVSEVLEVFVRQTELKVGWKGMRVPVNFGPAEEK